VFLMTNGRLEIARRDDPLFCPIADQSSDGEGRFRFERLVPGLRYTCEIHDKDGPFAGMAFENMVLKPGENRNLGDIRWQKPLEVRGQ
jgi:hypothetical protein